MRNITGQMATGIGAAALLVAGLAGSASAASVTQQITGGGLTASVADLVPAAATRPRHTTSAGRWS